MSVPDHLRTLVEGTARAGWQRPLRVEVPSPKVTLRRDFGIFEADGTLVALVGCEQDARLMAAALEYVLDEVARCDECSGSLLPGVLHGPVEATGVWMVERCDACERFDGDLDAAKALRDHLGRCEVCWQPHTDPDVRDLNGSEVVIMTGTDPWVDFTGRSGPQPGFFTDVCEG